MAVIRDILSENEKCLTYKSAVARWMNDFIHNSAYFENEAKIVASVLGIKTNEVFSIAQRIIQEGALSAEEQN